MNNHDTQTLISRAVIPAFAGAILIGAIPARLLMELWPPLGYLFWVIAPVVFIALVQTLRVGMTPSHCPACQRRLRNGQTRCHRCTTVL